MATRPMVSLTLSYPALDEKGQTLSPSPLLAELEHCFPADAIAKVTQPAGRIAVSEVPPCSQSEWRLGGMAGALEGKPQWLAGLVQQRETREVGQALLRGVQSVASRSDREQFGPHEGMLLSPAVREALARRFNTDHLWSPSQLENYAACPYRFFVRQLLRLEPLTELTLRSDPLRKGNLLHQVLAALHSQREPDAEAPSATELIERFQAALQKIIEDTPLWGLDAALQEIERREIFAWAAGYAKQELSYRQKWPGLKEPLQPAHFEVRFGSPSREAAAQTDPLSTQRPFVLDLGKEQIRLTGQIDRIDLGQAGGVTVFTVIDYKSGQAVQLKDQKIRSGEQLQLPLYLLAAQEMLHAEPLAAGYWNVKTSGFASGREALLECHTLADDHLESTPRWQELQGDIVSRIAKLIDGVRAAEFPVYNADSKCTEGCECSKICRISQIRNLEKTWPPGEIA
jgi:RecB family exonuclease